MSWYRLYLIKSAGFSDRMMMGLMSRGNPAAMSGLGNRVQRRIAAMPAPANIGANSQALAERIGLGHQMGLGNTQAVSRQQVYQGISRAAEPPNTQRKGLNYYSYSGQDPARDRLTSNQKPLPNEEGVEWGRLKKLQPGPIAARRTVQDPTVGAEQRDPLNPMLYQNRNITQRDDPNLAVRGLTHQGPASFATTPSNEAIAAGYATARNPENPVVAHYDISKFKPATAGQVATMTPQQQEGLQVGMESGQRAMWSPHLAQTDPSARISALNSMQPHVNSWEPSNVLPGSSSAIYKGEDANSARLHNYETVLPPSALAPNAATSFHRPVQVPGTKNYNMFPLGRNTTRGFQPVTGESLFPQQARHNFRTGVSQFGQVHDITPSPSPLEPQLMKTSTLKLILLGSRRSLVPLT